MARVLNKVFENIGQKIVFLSKTKFVLNIVALVITIFIATIFFGFADRLLYIFLMVIYCIAGVIFSVVGTWLLYGFGKVVNSVEIEESNKTSVIMDSKNKLEHADNDERCYLYNIDCTRNKNKASLTTKLLIILMTAIIVFIKFGFNLDLLILLKDISYSLCM